MTDLNLSDLSPQLPMPTHASPAVLLDSAACICRQWCRTDLNGQMIDGRRYPAPNHADGCPAQVRERFVRVAYHGHSCVIEPRDVEAMRGDVAADDYAFIDVHLTRDQFERMDEFAGF